MKAPYGVQRRGGRGWAGWRSSIEEKNLERLKMKVVRGGGIGEVEVRIKVVESVILSQWLGIGEVEVRIKVFESVILSQWLVRYGTWYRPPKTPAEAEDKGYERANIICQTANYHGFLYVHPGNNKSGLIFDYNNKLSGIQTMIPGNLYGHDANNESVRYPTKDVVPPILVLKEKEFTLRPQMFLLTAYFKHPSLICGPPTSHQHTGRGLYIQTGYRVEKQFERIPLEARHLSDDWKTGTCLPSMGRHYFKNLSKDLQCEKLYPVFLMYNDEGQLGGFGLLFQGVPPSEPSEMHFNWFKHSVQFYPAIFDQTMLPPCMFNPQFHVFGYRIYLRDEHTMTCPLVKVSGQGEDGAAVSSNSKNVEVTFRPLSPHEPGLNTTSRPTKYTKQNTQHNTNVIVDDVLKGRSGHNSASKNNFSHSLLCVSLLLSLFAAVVRSRGVSMDTESTQKICLRAIR
ncbi:hypothetical protein Btru_044917 [Bulinus truncatus]|nr:hypothetical protein Btru_044917 [Bulinus truncatus]